MDATEGTGESAHGDPLLPGTRLGDFEIEASIGRGGMGTVYRARQLSLGGRAVALKVHGGFGSDRTAAERFRREALIAASLRHPHLAAVYGFGEAQGRHFYAMELVEGPSARIVLERLAGDPAARTAEARRRLVAHAADLADALAELHRHDLVHRDVKPGNVLFRSNGEPLPAAPSVLVDFGLTRSIAGGGDETRSISGTPHYAAPEQLQGLRVDPRADVFGLGATLYDLLAARLPEVEPAPVSVGRPPIEDLVPGIDRDLAAVVGMAVDPKPEWRYPDGAALRDDLRAWLAGEPVAARRLRIVERVRRYVARHPERLLRLVAVSALVVGAAVALSLGTNLLRTVVHANEAARGADLAELHRALGDLPEGWMFRSLLADSARRAAETMAQTPSERLGRAAELAAGNDAIGALLQAATELKVNKQAPDPILRSYLLGHLRPGALDGHAATNREAAIELTARVFYEAPDQDAASAAASADFRERLVPLLDDPSVDPLHRMYVLTALSGCGTETEIEPLLERSARHPPGSEEFRLAIQCLERLLRRAHSCGFGARIEFDRVWALSAVPVAACLSFRPNSAEAHGSNTACVEYLRALVLLHRAQGGVDLEARLVGALPAGLQAGIAGRAREAVQFVLPCLPAARAPLVRDMLERAADGAVDDWLRGDPWTLGLAFGQFGDPELTEAFRRGDLCSGWGADMLASFERALTEAMDLASGKWPDREPDADTHLGVVPARGDALESARVDVLPALPPGTVDHDAAGKAIAQWEFRFGDVRHSGTAAGIATELCDIDRDGEGPHTFLRLAQPRASAVRFEFDVTEPAAYRPCELLLVHQIAARTYYPYKGRVLLDLEVDGVHCATLDVHDAAGHQATVDLSAALMAPGRRTVTLRLSARSTTGYWLHWAGLR